MAAHSSLSEGKTGLFSPPTIPIIFDKNSSGEKKNKKAFLLEKTLCTGSWGGQYCEEWMSPQVSPYLSRRLLELGMEAQGNDFSQEKGYQCLPQIHSRSSSSSLFLHPPPCCKLWAGPACNAVFSQMVTMALPAKWLSSPSALLSYNNIQLFVMPDHLH